MNMLTQEEAMKAFQENKETIETLLRQLELRVVGLEPNEILLHGRHLVQIREQLNARLMRMDLGQPPIDVLDPPSV